MGIKTPPYACQSDQSEGFAADAIKLQVNILDLKEEPEHIPTLADWHHNEWGYLNPDGSVQNRIEKMQSYLGIGLIPITFIAKEQSRLAGSAAIVKHDMDTKLELSPWLASVFVAPEYRQKGIGTKLVLHAMEKAKDVGVTTLYLFTPNKEHFYKELGWATFSEELYRGQEVAIMKISLDG